MKTKHFGYLPLSSDKQTTDPTWLKSSVEEDIDEPGITFCEWHPKAEPTWKDMSSPGDVAPATPEWPGAPPVQKPLTVQKSSPVPKSPPVQKVPVAPTTTTSPSTGAPQQTGAAPAAPMPIWPHP